MRRTTPALTSAAARGRVPGFTLIEVLAAFVLIAVVLPAVTTGISVCVKAEAQARMLMEAARLADSKLEELRTYASQDNRTLSGDFSPEHPEFRWTSGSITYDDYLQELMVIVSWTEASGERSFSLSTLLYGGSSSQ
jgi:prepilin-type N-terminal cleavage/methylation domain-containing protein